MEAVKPLSMIVLNNAKHGHTIAQSAGLFYNPDCDVCISRVENEELLGGVVYKDYTHASIAMHVASFHSGWLNRDMLWVCFDYPFNQLGCRKVFAQMRETNTKALEFNAKIGFKFVTKIEDVFPDGACIITSLAREDCRWLNLKPRGFVVANGD